MNTASHVTLGRFTWVEETSEFNEHFIKHYGENNDKGDFIEY